MNTLDPVFNILSATPLAESQKIARQRVSQLLNVLSQAPSKGLGGSVRVPENFYSLDLAFAYNFCDWLDDKAADREEINFFLALSAKLPFYSGVDQTVLPQIDVVDVTYEDKQSESLRAAYILEVPLVSFHHSIWQNAFISVKISELNDDGEIVEASHSQTNLSSVEHYESHAEWLKYLKFGSSISKNDLWAKRDILFPNLTFCASLESQILELDSNIQQLLLSRLLELERMSSSLRFDRDSFRTKCSPSSSSTLSKFGKHYIFRTPADDEAVCGWHLYLPDGFRIYFSPASFPFVIGHIGKHLPTKRFPA